MGAAQVPAHATLRIGATLPVDRSRTRSPCSTLIVLKTSAPLHLLQHMLAVTLQRCSFQYLGLWFHATLRSLALGSFADSVRKAKHAMRRRCFQLGYVHPRRMCNLFTALLLPILSYGCVGATLVGCLPLFGLCPQ